MIKCTLMLEYENSEKATLVEKSLKPDNEFFIRTRVEGNVVVAEAEAGSISSLLHTIDDFLACLSVAERVGEMKSMKFGEGQ
jgi:tRNA threonylcarbamoyladenosine modification (KEOPS) complex  Pcc1 subunit